MRDADEDELWRPTDSESRSTFWEYVHDEKEVDGVSWWQSVPDLSLGLVDQAGVPHDSAIIDVGAGWSTLVDHLVNLGYRDLTAIDLSATALQIVRERIGEPGQAVELTVADVLDLTDNPRYQNRFALWHDRAVFHFLTEQDERDDYRASLQSSVTSGGWVVVATFGPDGPATCSGLPIVRYTHRELAAEFPAHELVSTAGEDHVTPWGTRQQFTAVLLRARH
ncbi:MAG: class I SAM-dependent methyltransferase [Nocardioides sp.]